MKLVSIAQASKILGLSQGTLRLYANKNLIKTIRTEGGHRRFDVDSYVASSDSFIEVQPSVTTVCYCRVSSPKQKDDLKRQIEDMQKQFPDADVVSDIGSGLNFKRKGLNSILERAMSGVKLKLVVAHKDRLARFGFDLIDFMVRKSGGEIVVLHDALQSPESELTKDLLTILHVFSCRMHGLRRYTKALKEDPDLSK
jgi:predicted site-specific integrase-resolvase